MLGAMKGVKMCGLTNNLLTSLQRARTDELQISKRFRRLLIWNMGFGKYIRSTAYRLIPLTCEISLHDAGHCPSSHLRRLFCPGA